MLNAGCAAAAALLTFAPAAKADRHVSVGYTAPANLRGLVVVARVPALRTAEVVVPGAQAEQALRRRPGIRFVQRTQPRASADGPSVAGLTTATEWQRAAAHADTVPSWVAEAASTVTVAVIDTGADTSVPTLATVALTTYSVVTGTPTIRDTIGHGTFVASLISGATSDPNGMTGFGGGARLMIVQANRTGSTFSDLDEATAIVWAVDHGARIVNLSIGGSQTSSVERDAVDYATSHGVLLVAAAGNAAQQGNPTMYPAALIGSAGLVVGAATQTGARAPFSSSGSYVDLLAPGVDVLGALAGGVTTPLFSPVATPGAAGAYGIGSGTSYAAPEVAGAAALVWAANPLLDAAGVARMLAGTASGHGHWTKDVAYGNVDVAAAVTQAIGGTPPALLPPATTPKKAKQTTRRK